MNFLSTVFFGVNGKDFFDGLQKVIDNIKHKDGIFAGDNLFTFGRNLSFTEDEKFVNAWKSNAENSVEKAIIWRIYILAWAARSVIDRKIYGDFVECACYRGTTAKILVDYLDFINEKDRKYYLYDLFEHDSTMIHHAMPDHSPELYDLVMDKFRSYSNVLITKGSVPEILDKVFPQEIAFMHIDLNNAPAEIGALERLFDRLKKGGILVLDDYGWQAYRPQKLVEDPWLKARGYQVLELPTGQGIVIK